MAIVISKSLIKKLPEDEQADIEEFLWLKSGGVCFLCGEKLNPAAGTISADHDVPEAEGGETSRANLNLVHSECNAAKRNAPSIPVRPYLRFSAFVRKHGNLVKYGDCAPHFDIAVKTSTIRESEDTVTFHFPDGSDRTVPVLSEQNPRGEYRCAYVDVPRSALFNDEKCQPRAIKLAHVWSIYADLQRNPLHEAPGCRLETSGPAGASKILMFDGQHKTISSWLMGRDRILVKIYLNLSAEEAVELVNSVQAKIKKLPLSPFELSAKLADEWVYKLSRYEAAVGHENASEKGFIAWLPQQERTRGKQAFKAALVQGVLADESLEFRKYVGASDPDRVSITENTFKAKVLERLIHLDPLEEPADEGSILRARERNNIVKALNILASLAFEPEEGASELTPQQRERARRMTYQGSLYYIAGLIRGLFQQILVADSPRELVEKEPTPEQWELITDALKRLVSHLVWTAEENASTKMIAVMEALRKNQDFERAFMTVGLRRGYLVGADKMDTSWIAD